MKKKLLFILLPVVLVLGAGFAVVHLTVCDEGPHLLSGKKEANVVAAGNTNEEHSCCAAEKEAGEYTDNSIYQLESGWTDQDGNDFTLGELKGEKVVFTMFFASCTYACPILINDMQKIEKGIPSGELDDYKFVLLSIDHERDTPEALKEFAGRNGLDLNRWKLLHGNPGDILELANLMGFKYRKESDGSYSHSNVIYILDEQGEVEFQHKGLNKDVAHAVSVLNN